MSDPDIACRGKQPMPTWVEAHRRLMQQRHRRKIRRKYAGGGRLEIYRCPCCRCWHVGSTDVFAGRAEK